MGSPCYSSNRILNTHTLSHFLSVSIYQLAGQAMQGVFGGPSMLTCSLMLVACILLPSAGLADAESSAAAFLTSHVALVPRPVMACSRKFGVCSSSQLPRTALLPLAGSGPLKVDLLALMMQEFASDDVALGGAIGEASEASLDDGEGAEGGGGLSRKERRRLNRKSRNSR